MWQKQLGSKKNSLVLLKNMYFLYFHNEFNIWFWALILIQTFTDSINLFKYSWYLETKNSSLMVYSDRARTGLGLGTRNIGLLYILCWTFHTATWVAPGKGPGPGRMVFQAILHLTWATYIVLYSNLNVILVPSPLSYQPYVKIKINQTFVTCETNLRLTNEEDCVGVLQNVFTPDVTHEPAVFSAHDNAQLLCAEHL